MKVYKNSGGKNKLICPDAKINYFDSFIEKFFKNIYGEGHLKLASNNRMDEVDWFYKKDNLPCGHYVVEYKEKYEFYVIYETEEPNESYFSFYSVYRKKNINFLFSLFTLEDAQLSTPKKIKKNEGIPMSQFAQEIADIAIKKFNITNI